MNMWIEKSGHNSSIYKLNIYTLTTEISLKIETLMKAAFFYGPNDIRIKNIDTEIRTDGESKLRVLACSVCSYDVRTFRNGSFKVTPPVILGHEICAQTITDYKGKNFSIKSGTRVSIYPVIPCFECWYCNNNKYNLCSNLKEIGSTVNGGFAEFIRIPNRLFEIGGIVPVSDKISNEEAALIEPLACCINGINQIRRGDFQSIVIIGDGPIGLMQLILLRRLFPETNVTVIGKIKHRLESARKLGAHRTLEVTDNDFNPIIDALKKSDEDRAPNLIFISNNSSTSIDLALKIITKNGKLVIFSGIKNQHNNSNTGTTRLDPNFIHYNQITIFGSFSSNPENLIEAMNLVDSGEIKLSDFITGTYHLKDLTNAFAFSESFKGLKSVINKF